MYGDFVYTLKTKFFEVSFLDPMVIYRFCLFLIPFSVIPCLVAKNSYVLVVNM